MIPLSSVLRPGLRKAPRTFGLAGIVLALLASCDLRTLPSAIENVDESAYQVTPSARGGTLTLRIPVPEQEERHQEEHLRTEPPPGQSGGIWREDLNLIPFPVWTSAQEYWFGWFLLDLLAIHRDSLPDPRAWRSAGLAALYTAATKGKDPFTRYIAPADGQRIGSLLDGSNTTYDFGFLLREGVGDSSVVGYILPGGPAERSGLRRDDRILSADGKPLEEFLDSLDPAQAFTAEFRVRRPSTGAFLTVVTRSAPVIYPSVWVDTLPGGVGYIAITSFLSGEDNATDELFARALQEMESMRRVKSAWVLDLRDNGGGTIRSSLGVAGSLLGPGRPLVRIRERINVNSSSYRMRTLDTLLFSPEEIPRRLPEGRIVFLHDGGTASASEIVLSSLRENLDSTRLRTYGTRTYGKGIGQTYIPTPQGGFYAITLMTIDPVSAARYHGTGIQPDVPTAKDEILTTALRDILSPSVAGRGRTSAISPGLPDLDRWNLRERGGGAPVPLRRLEGPLPVEIW